MLVFLGGFGSREKQWVKPRVLCFTFGLLNFSCLQLDIYPGFILAFWIIQLIYKKSFLYVGPGRPQNHTTGKLSFAQVSRLCIDMAPHARHRVSNKTTSHTVVKRKVIKDPTSPTSSNFKQQELKKSTSNINIHNSNPFPKQFPQPDLFNRQLRWRANRWVFPTSLKARGLSNKTWLRHRSVTNHWHEIWWNNHLDKLVVEPPNWKIWTQNGNLPQGSWVKIWKICPIARVFFWASKHNVAIATFTLPKMRCSPFWSGFSPIPEISRSTWGRNLHPKILSQHLHPSTWLYKSVKVLDFII